MKVAVRANLHRTGLHPLFDTAKRSNLALDSSSISPYPKCDGLTVRIWYFGTWTRFRIP